MIVRLVVADGNNISRLQWLHTNQNKLMRSNLWPPSGTQQSPYSTYCIQKIHSNLSLLELILEEKTP